GVASVNLRCPSQRSDQAGFRRNKRRRANVEPERVQAESTMHDPSKLIIAVVGILAVTYAIRTYIAAAFPKRRDVDPTSSLGDARLSRLEQAVDAIALEVERISEGQRFTTRLLSDQAQQKNSVAHELPTRTPT